MAAATDASTMARTRRALSLLDSALHAETSPAGPPCPSPPPRPPQGHLAEWPRSARGTGTTLGSPITPTTKAAAGPPCASVPTRAGLNLGFRTGPEVSPGLRCFSSSYRKEPQAKRPRANTTRPSRALVPPRHGGRQGASLGFPNRAAGHLSVPLSPTSGFRRLPHLP